MKKCKIAKKQIASMIMTLVMLFTISIPTMAGKVLPEIKLNHNITAEMGDDIQGISMNVNGWIWLVKSGETGIDADSLRSLKDDSKATSTYFDINNLTSEVNTRGILPGVYQIYGEDEYANISETPSEYTVTITSAFSGGTGTEADPFLITTAKQLQKIYDSRNLYFSLKNDIDLSAVTDWIPIRARNINLEGNYHVVKGLTIDYSEKSTAAGLFGYLYQSTIKHLGIVDANIKGTDNGTGILAGQADKATHIEEVYTTGTVLGDLYVGGLVGINEMSDKTILNCYSLANVKGSGVVGGLVGLIQKSSLKTSYSAGQVVIENSNNQKAGDSLKTYGEYIGGLVAADNPDNETPANIFLSNYYDTQTSGQSDSTGATGKTTAEMKTKATFLAGTGDEIWDFTNVWGINATYNNGYPYLKGFNPDVKVIESKTAAVVASIEGVDGTTFNPSTVLSIEDISSKITTDKKTTINAGIKMVANGDEIKQLFDIKLLLDGVPVQPDGSVTIKIKLTPEQLLIQDLQIVYIDNAGKSVIIPSKIVDGYLIFTTNHFSNYAIIGKIVTPVVAPNPNTWENAILYVFALFGISTLIILAIFKSKKKE